jgi:branched-chain amino acid transport system ATP-binding protein
MGLGRTFQIPRPFEKLTAYENVMVGGIFGDGLSEKEAGRKAAGILGLIGLYEKAGTFAGKLGLLDRKRLEIGAALASNPKVLLFDEVAGGLTESEVVEILDIVVKLKAGGVSVIWIEHVRKTMLEGTDRVMCLAQGRDVICGLPAEVMASKEVAEVYLGADEDE